MKKLSAVLLIFIVMLSFCSCSKTNVDTSADVTLVYVYADKNINLKLSDDEASKVIDILNEKDYDSITSGVPSCGFNANVSLKIGDNSFAIACDTCNYVQDLSNMKYFAIPQEDMKYIHTLFEEYGGHFPCI